MLIFLIVETLAKSLYDGKNLLDDHNFQDFINERELANEKQRTFDELTNKNQLENENTKLTNHDPFESHQSNDHNHQLRTNINMKHYINHRANEKNHKKVDFNNKNRATRNMQKIYQVKKLNSSKIVENLNESIQITGSNEKIRNELMNNLTKNIIKYKKEHMHSRKMNHSGRKTQHFNHANHHHKKHNDIKHNAHHRFNQEKIDRKPSNSNEKLENLLLLLSKKGQQNPNMNKKMNLNDQKYEKILYQLKSQKVKNNEHHAAMNGKSDSSKNLISCKLLEKTNQKENTRSTNSSNKNVSSKCIFAGLIFVGVSLFSLIVLIVVRHSKKENDEFQEYTQENHDLI